jgi:Concanavalin A-like lectin/glucanases superfamily
MKGDRNTNAETPFYVLVGHNNLIAGVRTDGHDHSISSNLVHLRLDPKVWHHVAVRFNARRNLLNLWLDGKHIAHMSVPDHSPTGNTLPLEIGRNGPATGDYWIGKLDDVRIWNVARRGTDITASYKAQLNGPPARPGRQLAL